MKELIEYRVREVPRYIVTRYEEEHTGDKCSAGSSVHGEFDNFDTAYAVAYALCKAEHDKLGWPPGDERIQYPHSMPPGTRMTLDPAFHTAEEIAAAGEIIVE